MRHQCNRHSPEKKRAIVRHNFSIFSRREKGVRDDPKISQLKESTG